MAKSIVRALELVPDAPPQDAAGGRTDPAEGEGETHGGPTEAQRGAEAAMCGPCRRGNHMACDWDEQMPPKRCSCACMPDAEDGTDA